MDESLTSLPDATWMLVASVALMIAVEMVIEVMRRRRVDVRDSVNSMTIGLGYLFVKIIAGKALAFAGFLFIFDKYRFFTLDVMNPLHWIAAWLVGDFFYYWIHRAEHRVRVLWCTHLVHHSSKEFSFTTAVRMPWTEVFYKPITGIWAPLIGVHPTMGAVMGVLALGIGQLQHTKLIGSLGPIDRLFQTPSNHRVHHGSNPEYIDKNFGGSLMIWDRCFGTYEPEVATPVYGLTKDLEATTPWAIAKGGYPELMVDLRETESWRDRARICVGAPA
jgi:sterol desaturase/sphingolipid hydroxylase (fatty acid hydroxylase superfamily)